MVFQDPADSLNPRFTAFDTIAEPPRRLGRTARCVRRRVEDVADLVGLPHELLGRFPHQLSGGQQQRVGIARAIAVNPTLLVLDEPTSALDVSVQAVILHLLADLRRRLGMTYLFVSHDLNVVRLLCDRVLVMYLGKIVESGPVDAIFDHPAHPYTRMLFASIPGSRQAATPTGTQVSTPSGHGSRHLTGRGSRDLSGHGSKDPSGRGEAREPASPMNPSPHVCRFFGRCPDGFDRCEQRCPRLPRSADDHEVACHLTVGSCDRPLISDAFGPGR